MLDSIRLTLTALLCLCVVPLACQMAVAAPAGDSTLSLSALVDEALRENPEIKSARERWQAAKAVVPQVQSLPDPQVKLGYQQIPALNAIEGPLYGVGQGIPFPGKLRLRGEVAARGADRAAALHQGVLLRVIAQLKRAYFTLHFVHKSIDIVGKNLKILEEFEKTAEARYKVGKGIQQDIFRAQVELSRELERLTTLEQEKETLHADINRILNRPPAAPLGRPEEVRLTPLAYELEQLNELALTHSPLIKAQARGIQQGQSAVDLARREYYPDFDLTALGTRNDRLNTNGYQVIMGIKVPLYYGTKQRYGVSEALSQLEGARKDHNTTMQDVLFRVKDNVARVKRAAKLTRLLQDAIVPQASLALESSIAGYSVGNVDFLTMLDNLLRLQRDEIDLHQELTSHEIAIVGLEEAVGVQIQASGP